MTVIILLKGLIDRFFLQIPPSQSAPRIHINCENHGGQQFCRTETQPERKKYQFWWRRCWRDSNGVPATDGRTWRYARIPSRVVAVWSASAHLSVQPASPEWTVKKSESHGLIVQAFVGQTGKQTGPMIIIIHFDLTSCFKISSEKFTVNELYHPRYTLSKSPIFFPCDTWFITSTISLTKNVSLQSAQNHFAHDAHQCFKTSRIIGADLSVNLFGIML